MSGFFRNTQKLWQKKHAPIVVNIYVFNFPSSSGAPDVSSENNLSSVASEWHSDIPLFKYIHVAVTDEKEREQIHKIVYNIVRLPKMKQICDELYLLIKKEKILSTIKPEAMLAELRRIGMPSADTPGFSDQNFYSNYRA